MDDGLGLFKCRKCRFFLFDSCTVLNYSGSDSTPSAQQTPNSPSCCLESSSVWYIREDEPPDWVGELVNQGNWLKGKLFCPKCAGRLGSFDFVTGSKCSCKLHVLPAIRIVKAKVDCHLPPTKEPSAARTTPPAESVKLLDTPDGLPLNLSRPLAVTTESVVVKTYSESIVVSNAATDFSPGTHSLEPTSLMLAQEETQLSPSHDGWPRPRLPMAVKRQLGESPIGLDESFDLTMGSPVSEDVRDALTCPVCLDVLYDPTLCHPCGHHFCDPCLRRLAKNNPNNTLCPLCRQLIQQCTPHKELGQQVTQYFQTQYVFRKKIEQNSGLQAFPLPWRPRYHFRWFSSGGGDVPYVANFREMRIFSWRVTFRRPSSRALAAVLLEAPAVHFQLSTVALLTVLLVVCIVTCTAVYICMKYIMWFFRLSPEASHCLVSHVVIFCFLTLLKLSMEQYVLVRH